MANRIYQESSLQISYNSSAVFTTSEMKAHLRVTGSSEDTLIDTYTKAATRWVENYTRRLMLPGTVTEIFTSAPGTGGTAVMLTNGAFTFTPPDFYSLKIGNATSITSVSANTTDNTASFTALSTTSLLNADFNKPRVYAPDGWTFGTISPFQIKIVYAAGYANAAAVPNDIKVAIMLVCADMFENRMDSVRQLPTAAEILLATYKVEQGV